LPAPVMKPVYAALSVRCNGLFCVSSYYNSDRDYNPAIGVYVLTSEYNVDIVVAISSWS